MKYAIKGKLAQVSTLRNSANGNPRYECRIVPFDGEPINPVLLTGEALEGRTKSDSMFCYNMPSPGNWVQATYRITGKGRVVFDDITAL